MSFDRCRDRVCDAFESFAPVDSTVDLRPSSGVGDLVVAAGRSMAFCRWLAIDPLSRLFVGFISLLFFLCRCMPRRICGRDQNVTNRVICACLLATLAMMSLSHSVSSLGFDVDCDGSHDAGDGTMHLLQPQSALARGDLEISCHRFRWYCHGSAGIILSGLLDDPSGIGIDAVV